MTAQRLSGEIVESTRTATATITSSATAPVANSGAAVAQTPLALMVPANWVVSANNGEIRLAGAVNTGTDTLTVVLAVSGGPTGATPTLTASAGNGASGNITLSGSGTANLSLTGTASDLRTFLAAADQIRFNGTG
ncbi:MAG: hypothetical protein EB027_07295, partial [Actinobacteria bacterium]|nr:hypothetical protein [Actinomycetota bacterium]